MRAGVRRRRLGSGLVIGTTEGAFLAAASQAPRASDLSSRDVKVVRQADGHVLAGTDDGVYRSAAGGRGLQRVGLEGPQLLEALPPPPHPPPLQPRPPPPPP